MPVIFAVLLALVTGRTASAQERPRTTPSRDVAVVYRITDGESTTPQTVRVSYTNEGKKARLDFFAEATAANAYGSTIIDQEADRVVMLLPARRGYVEQPAGPARALAFPLDASMQFSGGKQDTVIGLPCRVWQLQGDGTEGTACVTEDGVLLRGTRAKPKVGMIEAVSITYGTQPADLFVPPPGYIKLIRVPRTDPRAAPIDTH